MPEDSEQQRQQNAALNLRKLRDSVVVGYIYVGMYVYVYGVCVHGCLHLHLH